MLRVAPRLALLALAVACGPGLPEPGETDGASSTSSGTDAPATTTTGAPTTGAPTTGTPTTGTPTTGTPPSPSTCNNGQVDIGEVCLGAPVLVDATPVDHLWTADVDGDGRTDLLTELGLWLQRDGGFEPGALPPELAPSRGFIDFDGDGHPDIFANDSDARTFALSRNDGAGNFAAPVVTDVTPLRAITPLDVDGDGRDEFIAQAIQLDAVRIYAATDDGQIAPLMTQNKLGWMTWLDGVGDGNGDGLPDLLMQDPETVTIWWGQGDGSFADSQEPLASVFTARFADLDGQGADEIAFTHSFFPQFGTDSHVAGVLWLEGAPTEWPRTEVALAGDTGRVFVGDLSSDGLADLIVPRHDASFASVLEVLCLAPDRSLAACADLGLDFSIETLAAAHINPDGALDLVVAAGDHGVWVIPATP